LRGKGVNKPPRYLPSCSLSKNFFRGEITLDFIMSAIKDHVVETSQTASFKVRLEECFYVTLYKATAVKTIKSV
jgi:hypothetical protein